MIFIWSKKQTFKHSKNNLLKMNIEKFLDKGKRRSSQGLGGVYDD